jgi:aminoglycoside/choline kinase family phosphotransferase
VADFPTHPDELDLAWLTDSTGIDSLGAFTAERMTGGFWSKMVRLHLKHSDPTVPATLVAKFANGSDQARFICATFRLNRTELNFYQTAAADLAVKCPTVYSAQSNDDFTNYALLMEDMGTQQLDQLVGCPAEQATAVVDALAKLHSSWWEQPRLGDLEWLCKPEAMANRLTQVMSMVADQALANLQDCPREIADAWPQLMHALPLLLNQLDDQPATLTHGDVRLSNLFFTKQGPGFVDWQAARHAHSCYDLAYFLTQSLSTATRREHEANLIRHYQQQLVQHGTDAPSIDELDHAYKLCAVYCLVYPIIAASSAHASDSPEALQIAERAFSAVIDTGALELVI